MFRTRGATLLYLFILLFGFLWPVCGHAQVTSEGAVFTPLPMPLQVPNVLIEAPIIGAKTMPSLLFEKKGARVIILHLWAPNCLPCRTEMRALDAAYPALKAKGYEIFAVTEDPHAGTTAPHFARYYSIRNLPLYLDEYLRLMTALRPRGLPISYLVTPEGQIIGEHAGSLDWIELARRPD